MITIDLNFGLKDLDGTEVAHAGQVIGNKLVGTNSSDYLKWFQWGQSLYNKKSISVDNADFDSIKDFIKNHKEITVLAKAPVMEYLTNLKYE
jgi:hypothetical protein